MLKRLKNHSLDLEDEDLFNIITIHITQNPLNEPRLLILSENLYDQKKKKGPDSALATSVIRSVKRSRTSKKTSNSSNNSNSQKGRTSSYRRAVGNRAK